MHSVGLFRGNHQEILLQQHTLIFDLILLPQTRMISIVAAAQEWFVVMKLMKTAMDVSHGIVSVHAELDRKTMHHLH
jgi:hypothetical protein